MSRARGPRWASVCVVLCALLRGRCTLTYVGVGPVPGEAIYAAANFYLRTTAARRQIMAERKRRAAIEPEAEPPQRETVGRGQASSSDACAELPAKRLRGSSSTSAAADEGAGGGGHAFHVLGNVGNDTAAHQTVPHPYLATHLTVNRVVCCVFCYVNGRWPESMCGAIVDVPEAGRAHPDLP